RRRRRVRPRRPSRHRGAARAHAGVRRRRRAADAVDGELRPVRELRASRRRVPRAGGGAVVRKQATLESQLLLLVPLALTAFGLVMVYSATSASAALGGGNSAGYLERQGTYALLGLAALVVAARTDFRALKAMAPTLLITALGLCLAVLAVGERINGARRWIG